MKTKPLSACDVTCQKCGRTVFSVVVAVLAAGLLGVVLVTLAFASPPPDACLEGYVWREAFPGDHVCVAPEARAQAAADNRLAAERRAPGGGAYGPDTCKPGFVWREARPDDHVCVTPEVRTQTARDNSLAHTRRAMPPAAANGGSAKPYGAFSANGKPGSAQSEAKMREPASAPELEAAAREVAMRRHETAREAVPPPPAPMAAPTPAPKPAPTTASKSVSQSFKLPTFPWPPPPFSTRMKLDRALLVAGQAAPTNGSVAARMEKALAANGYSQLSYYAVPDGFALVTQIERIDAQAASAAEQRWSTQIPGVALIPFNLDAYIKALLGKNGDSFRVIVFVFTPTPFTAGGPAVAPGEAMAWAEKGATALPAALAARPYGSNTICTALVYEFRISSLGAAAKRPGAFNGEQHLRAAGILKTLERAP